jgi:Raf kinase inhibitor-like YbhB/YbcL family protein
MRLWSDSFTDGQPIPERHALGRRSPTTHAEPSENRSPPLAWDAPPAETKSLVLICHDRDVPSRADDVNKEGREVPAELPRVDFFHLVLVDLPPVAGSFAEGALASGVTPHGKPPSAAPAGTRCGLNDYTGWFKGDPAMEGQYHGYDGPWPPWNDSIIHHYAFTLYATDLARCPVEGSFTGQQVRSAITGHVLGQAVLSGTYTINPAAR